MQLISKNNKYKKVKRFQGGDPSKIRKLRRLERKSKEYRDTYKDIAGKGTIVTQDDNNKALYAGELDEVTVRPSNYDKGERFGKEVINSTNETGKRMAPILGGMMIAPFAIGGMAANIPATIGGMIGDAATQGIVRGTTKYDSWGDMLHDKTGLNPFLAELVNPGAWAGGIAAKPVVNGVKSVASKVIPKKKVIVGDIAPLEDATVKTYEDLKVPSIKERSPEWAAVDQYVASSKGFKYDYSSRENFIRSYFKDSGFDINQLLNAKPGSKMYEMIEKEIQTFKNYPKHLQLLEDVTTRTKGDRFRVIRHTDEKLPIGEYEPKRPLSFSFPKGSTEFGDNRLIIDIPEEQSYLATDRIINRFKTENEVVLPRKLKYKIEKGGTNKYGGTDYWAKILNPYLMLPITTTNFINGNNERK